MSYQHNDEPICRCRCGAWIYFKREMFQAPHPINLETGESHFADCPYADEYRGSGKRAEERAREMEEAARRQTDLFG